MSYESNILINVRLKIKKINQKAPKGQSTMKKRIFTSLKLITAVLVSSLLFTQAKAQTGCAANWTSSVAGCTVKFTDNSTVGTNTQWNWNFGDGQTSNLQNPSHTYSVSGTYSVCLSILTWSPNTCYNTLCKPLTVQCPTTKQCTALWNWQSTTNSCTVYFTDASTATSPITSWSWNFGDGQTSTMQNPVHTYSASGSYSVCLTITAATPNGSCTDILCKTVTVQCPTTTQCIAYWLWQSGTASSCTISFTDASTGSPITSWNWNFGDGQTSNLQNPVHTYSASGTYSVCLTIVVVNASSGTCYKTLCKTVTVQCGPLGIASSGQIDISLSVTNPVFSSADIHYSISSSGRMELVLFDIVGNKIGILESGSKGAGMYSYLLNTDSYAKGIYFIHLDFEGTTLTKKIIITH